MPKSGDLGTFCLAKSTEHRKSCEGQKWLLHFWSKVLCKGAGKGGIWSKSTLLAPEEMRWRGFGSIDSKHDRVTGRIIEEGESLEEIENLEILSFL